MRAPSAWTTGLSELENALKSLVIDRPLPLYRMMAYQMGWVDQNGEEQPGVTAPERARAPLTMLVCRSMGGRDADALPYACAVEYLYNHFLVHDDVRDGNTERAGRGSVWWVWGPAQAINTGDGMHALARLALFEIGEGGKSPEELSLATQVLDDAGVRTCEGQYLDIAYQERLNLMVDEYLKMAEAQNGSLAGAACRLGALASGRRGDEALEAVASFGAKLGTAMRLGEDLRMFWPEGERDQVQQGRLISKKKTLPVAHVLERGSHADRRKVGEMYMGRVIDPEVASQLIATLEAAGSREFTECAADRLLEEALAALEPVGFTGDTLQEIEQTARYLTGRGV
ncbi:MAG: polyprenyl synthetase family protein [Chloroflexota bacterium]